MRAPGCALSQQARALYSPRRVFAHALRPESPQQAPLFVGASLALQQGLKGQQRERERDE